MEQQKKYDHYDVLQRAGFCKDSDFFLDVRQETDAFDLKYCFVIRIKGRLRSDVKPSFVGTIFFGLVILIYTVHKLFFFVSILLMTSHETT